MNERQELQERTNIDDSERYSLSSRFEFESVVKVLKERFPNYPDDSPALASLSPTLEPEVLRQIFSFVCRAPSFETFCEELNALLASRDAQSKALDDEQRRELATSQIFNNFVVAILEKRRRIGASFLKRRVEEISPKVAQELDFDAYSTEPTVHIFGAQVSRLCDLVFSVPFKDRSKGAQPIVVPLEHKSTQTRAVVFQLLTSLVLVLQYIQRHKERFQRKDKKFVWPFLLLFYTGARPWKKVLNLPDLFATPDAALDKRWIFKLPFKFVSLFTRPKKQIEADPWLEAFLALTKAAERIVVKKDATSDDWKKAWNDAFNTLAGKIDPDNDEELEMCGEFFIFVSKIAMRQGWVPPTRDEITYKLEELGGEGNMTRKIESFYDLGRASGWEDGRASGWKDGRTSGLEEGEQRGLRSMLKDCIVLRFPQTSQTTLNNILSITDSNVLKSIFNVACTSDSLDSFQRDIRGMASVN